MDRETEASTGQLRQMEALLRRSRPAPSADFETSLASRLFPGDRTAVQRQPRRRRRPVLLGITAAGATACAALGLSLAGVGPLAAGGTQDVGAKSDCRYVTERHAERVPTITHDANGRARLTLRSGVVERRVKRCR